MKRTETRPIMVGNVQIGGQNRCVLQSMTNVPAKDVQATVQQIRRLEAGGCEIARIAVLDEADAEAIPAIKQQVTIPVVADIHFNYLLALKAMEGGVSGSIPATSAVKNIPEQLSRWQRNVISRSGSASMAVLSRSSSWSSMASHVQKL